MPQLSEKPRQGFETKKTAWNPGPSVYNSTAAIGLRAGLALECVRETRQTGLYYMPARYYSPALGRFLQADPSGFAGGLNLYAYAENDPVNQADSTGMSPDGGGLTIRLSETIATWFGGMFGVPSITVGAPAHTMPCNCSLSILSGQQLTMVYTLMGEQTPESAVGTQRYGNDQSGTNPGKPNGPIITDETLNMEATLMAGIMLNRGNIGNKGTYTGLPQGINNTKTAMNSSNGSLWCTQLQRDVYAVQHPTDTYFNQWRTAKQGNWVHPLNGGSRLGQLNFFWGPLK